MLTHEGKERIKGYVQCYNDFDVDGMMCFLSDTVVFENESGGEVNARAEGKPEFRELAEQAAKMFSARNQKITGLEANGDVFVAHVAYEATLAVDLPNGPKQGQSIALSGRSEFRFDDGKISHIRDIS